MATVPPFVACGNFNGFGVTESKEDVSGLSDVLPLTLKEAAKLWWMLHEITPNLTATWTGPSFSYSASVATPAGFTPSDPRFRVKGFSGFPSANVLDGIESDRAAQVAYSTGLGPRRFYDGPTNDEANFIGYGCLFLQYEATFYDSLNPFAQLFVGYSSVTDSDPSSVITTVTLGGINFLRKVTLLGTAPSPGFTWSDPVLDFYTVV